MKLLIILCCALVALVSCSSRKAFFVKIGSYKGKTADNVEYSKSYYMPRALRGSWQDARVLCQSYSMQLARLQTQAEFNAMRQLANANKDLFTMWTLVDGGSPTLFNVKPNATEWYFTGGAKIPYNMEWMPGQPDLPAEKCLSLAKDANFKYNNIQCFGTYFETFICEDLTP